MKIINIAVWLTLVAGASLAKNIEKLGPQDVVLQDRDGEILVTIHPTGKWTWNHKPEEVVSEEWRMIGALYQELMAEKVKSHDLQAKLDALKPAAAPSPVSSPVNPQDVHVPTTIVDVKMTPTDAKKEVK